MTLTQINLSPVTPLTLRSLQAVILVQAVILTTQSLQPLPI